MRCYDGAEVCELVGSHLLSKLSNIVDKESVGLYRGDGLGVLQNLSSPQTERKKKAIVKVFKDYDLRITVQSQFMTTKFP